MMKNGVYFILIALLVAQLFKILIDANQPRSQGLSSLPPVVVGTETQVAAGHVTTQNLGGRKICWKGGVFYRPLDQMYLSTHPHCGF